MPYVTIQGPDGGYRIFWVRDLKTAAEDIRDFFVTLAGPTEYHNTSKADLLSSYLAMPLGCHPDDHYALFEGPTLDVEPFATLSIADLQARTSVQESEGMYEEYKRLHAIFADRLKKELHPYQVEIPDPPVVGAPPEKTLDIEDRPEDDDLFDPYPF